jgi:SAM-dependent methyltransferase
MSVFNNYSNYYDLLYKDKDYSAEVEYIDNIIKKYATKNVKTILDLGCGTGGHAFLFAEKGYTITGLDISKTMLDIANRKLEIANDDVKNRLKFINHDARNIKIGTSFDAVVSLFHVMSYQTSNEDLILTFQSVYNHLNQSGIFIFDFWYGPAVLTNKPDKKLKILENNELKIFRFADPVLHPNDNVVDVNYTVLIQNKYTKAICDIKETHRMRYLFKPEIELMFKDIGFHILDCFEYMTDKTINLDSWSVCIVAEK